MAADTERPPTLVLADAEEIYEESGIEPTIEYISSTRWKVTVTTDRVTAAYTYKTAPTANKRASRVEGTLTVDGLSRAPALNPKHLAEILAHPGGPDDPVQPDPVPTGGNPGAAPPMVLHMRGILLHKLGTRASTATTAMGYDNVRHIWVLGLDLERATFRFYFRRKKLWTVDSKNPFQIIVNGVDRTYEAGGEMKKMMELLAAGMTDLPDSPAATGHPANAKANNGLTVRKTTVIRV